MKKPNDYINRAINYFTGIACEVESFSIKLINKTLFEIEWISQNRKFKILNKEGGKFMVVNGGDNRGYINFVIAAAFDIDFELCEYIDKKN